MSITSTALMTAIQHTAVQHIEARGVLGTIGAGILVVILVIFFIGLALGLAIGFFVGRAFGRRGPGGRPGGW